MTRTHRKRLNDVFNDWISTGGIFHELDSYDVPWKSKEISPELDLQYHGNRSGQKIIAPLVNSILDGAETLTPLNKTLLASTVFSLFGDNWAKQWETLSFEYNPIENYRMVENMTDDETVKTYGKTSTRTDNLTHRKTGTETDTIDDDTTMSGSGSDTEEQKTHGFNSSSGVRSDDKENTKTATQSSNRDSETETTYNTTDAETGTQSFADGGTDTETHNYELTRSGNIGTLTTQQMIRSEREIWMWNFFETVVFPDIDRVLTISIY